MKKLFEIIRAIALIILTAPFMLFLKLMRGWK